MNVSDIAQMVFNLMDQGIKERLPVEPDNNAARADSVELTQCDAAGTPDNITLVSSLGVTVVQAQPPGTSSSAVTPAPAESASAHKKDNASE